jgi:type VI secretion system secreted protein Hcp
MATAGLGNDKKRRPQMAATAFFLKIEGIDGVSADAKHKGEIDLESWSWGQTQSGARAAGGGAGKVNMQDFHAVMKVCKASPRLMLACATGQPIQKAVLTCRQAGTDQQEYLKVTMTDLLVSSYQTGGNGHGGVPTDQFSLNFARIEFEYREQRPDGTLGGAVKAGYDLKANQRV